MKRFGFLLCVLAVMWSGVAARAAELVIQKGHDAQLDRVAISYDGRYLASAAGEDPIKLWQAERGEFVRDLPSSQGELPLIWSPDGAMLLTAVRDINYAAARATPGIKVRAMPSGAVLRSLRGVHAPLFFDGKIVRETDGKVLRDWDVTDGKLISTRALSSSIRKTTLRFDGEAPRLILTEGSTQDDSGERSFAFSRNGEYLVFGGEFEKGVARVWDARSGRLLHEVRGKGVAFGLAAVSDDGRWMVTQGDNPKWQPPGPDSPGTMASYARQLTLHLWDLKTQKPVRSWPGYQSLDDGVTFLRFSRDGKRVFSGGDSGSSVWDAQTGKKIRDLKVARNIDLAGNDRFLAGGLYQDLQVAEVATGKILRTMPGQMRGGASLAWSPDGNYLASGDELQIWDSRNARLLTTPARIASRDSGVPVAITSPVFHRNKNARPPSPPVGTWLSMNRARWKSDTMLQTEDLQFGSLWRIDAAANSFAGVKIFEPGFAKSKAEDEDDFDSDSYSNGVFLSPDGALLLSKSRDFDFLKQGVICVWNAATKKLLRTIEINKVKTLGDMVQEPFWLPDSTRFLIDTKRGFETWNARTGKRERQIAASRGYLLLTISSNGKYVAATRPTGQRKSLMVWEIATSRLVRAVPCWNANHATFSPDDKRLAIGVIPYGSSKAPTTEIWDWRGGVKPQLVLPLIGYSGNVWEEAPAWSPDGKRLAIAADTAIAIYNTENGGLLGRMALGVHGLDTDANDWLIWTPDGFFNAPDKGRLRVRWMENGELIPLDSPRDHELRDEHFQPERVGQILHGASEAR